MKLRLIALAAPIAMLAACSGGNGDAEDGDDMNAASQGALNENLATDPDLANSSEEGAALSGTGNQNIPKIDTSERAIEDARSRAVQMVGGSANMDALPTAKRLGEGAGDTPAMVQAARALQGSGNTNCFEKVSYSASWSAKLPAEFPIYPRGNTIEAAGSDEGNCAVRAVTFRTGVPKSDVLAFYATRAADAGYTVEHALKGGENVLSAIDGQSAMVIYARDLPGKVTEIDLVTSKR